MVEAISQWDTQKASAGLYRVVNSSVGLTDPNASAEPQIPPLGLKSSVGMTT